MKSGQSESTSRLKRLWLLKFTALTLAVITGWFVVAPLLANRRHNHGKAYYDEASNTLSAALVVVLECADRNSGIIPNLDSSNCSQWMRDHDVQLPGLLKVNATYLEESPFYWRVAPSVVGKNLHSLAASQKIIILERPTKPELFEAYTRINFKTVDEQSGADPIDQAGLTGYRHRGQESRRKTTQTLQTVAWTEGHPIGPGPYGGI